MEYYQPSGIDNLYDGSYLLILPLFMLLLTNIVAELLVGTKIECTKLRLKGFNIYTSILPLLIALILAFFKYNISIMTVIFDRFILAFFIYDKISLIRKFLSFFYMPQSTICALRRTINYKLNFDMVVSLIEFWSYKSLTLYRGKILLVCVLIDLFVFGYFDGGLNILEETKTLNSKNLIEERSWIENGYLRITLTFLFQYVIGFGFFDEECQVHEQFLTLMCIMLISIRSILMGMSWSVILITIDCNTVKEKDYLSGPLESIEVDEKRAYTLENITCD